MVLGGGEEQIGSGVNNTMQGEKSECGEEKSG